MDPNNPIVLNSFNEDISNPKLKQSPAKDMDSSSLSHTVTPCQVNLSSSEKKHQTFTEFDFFKDYKNNDHNKVVVSPSASTAAVPSPVLDIDQTNMSSLLDFKLSVSHSIVHHFVFVYCIKLLNF